MNKDQSIEDKITETIDKYITPSVSMHGGKIELLSYDKKDKHVHVKLSGSCAGCASSIYTLKMGCRTNTTTFSFLKILKVYRMKKLK